QAITVAFPDKVRLDYTYGEFSVGNTAADNSAVEIEGKDGVHALPPDVYEFIRRRLYREPLALLRARNEPGFVVFASGTGEVEGQHVEWVNAGYAGATTRLGIEPTSGRILAVTYRGRAPSKLGEVRKTYSDFKKMEGGLTLPQHSELTYDGEPASGP